jgi:tetratricopeptide (TPR) repeat protein/cell division septation protein DedD
MMIRTTYKAAAGALLMAVASLAAPARSQDLLLSADPMEQARAAVARRDPAEALGRFLRVLSTRPKDLEALTGAGQAALDIGDPSAAIGFYARAEEIAPRNGRVKAGLGTAMLQMENAKAALRLFDDAVDLGVPPGDVAGDRGLAYDLRGDNKRAQQEYALALRTREDPETRRRMALSLAMTGDRPGALAALDPLLRRQDIPAWRVRAFVLALTGDAAGAEKSALAVMPQPQAMALLPFLSRLPSLKPQQQAAAVHFGHFPSDGKRYGEGEMLADAGSGSKSVATAADMGLIPSGAPLGRGGSATAASSSAPVSTAPRRRPGASEDRLASVMASILAKPEVMATPEATITSVVTPKPVPPLAPSEPFIGPPAKVEPGFTALPRPAPPLKVAQAEPAKPVSSKLTLLPKKPAETSLKAATKEKDSALPKDAKAKESAKSELASKGKDAKSKDTAKTKDAAKTKEAAKAKDGDKAKDAKAKGSERYWVQVAGGANKEDLPKAYGKLKEKSPKLFAGRSAWTTSLRATNRLLVGPFKTSEEAQLFVNRAGKDKLSVFAYTSPAGQDVEKLGAK